MKVVEGLAERHRGMIYWLIGPDVGLDPKGLSSNIRVAPKWSLTGIRSYLTAEAVFFTHGIYGDVLPATGKTFINLWHGDPVKLLLQSSEQRRRSRVPSNYIVGGTNVFTLKKASTFRVPAERILADGQPSHRPVLRPCRRQASGMRSGWTRPGPSWSGCRLSANRGGAKASRTSPRANPSYSQRDHALRGVGPQRRGHPGGRKASPAGLPEARTIPGMLNVDNEILLTNRTSLYAFLGKSAELITDYSSVWTDYLVLDRPLGSSCPTRTSTRPDAVFTRPTCSTGFPARSSTRTRHGSSASPPR